jgi:antitoxin (DNA-binding transcriptional repressor) of toxin-antitoxin stability system
MDALECKAKFFHVLDEVESKRKGIVATGNGKPVAEIVPFIRRPRTLYAMKGSIQVMGDLDEPTDGDWEALKE